MLPLPSDGDLARFMEPVARALFGDPNERLSSQTEKRFGSNGSMSVDLAKGTAYSHEDKQGGGVLWLIEREKKLHGADAFQFLRDIGCDVPELNKRANGAHPPPALGKIIARYDYSDERGELLFQVVRFEPKTFRQRRPDQTEQSGWSYSVKGIRQVPYRLIGLIEALAQDRPVFIVEGEKDVDNLAKWGVTATCNAGGAGKWPESLTELFRDADVVLIPDNDPQAKNPETGALIFYAADHPEFPNQPAFPGPDHCEMVARRLQQVARRVRILKLPGLPPKGDVSDWIAQGGTPEEFYALAEDAPDWTRRPDMVVSRFGGQRWEDIAVSVASGASYAWAIEDIVPMGEITLAFGDSGSGKSFGVFDMGMSVARALSFNGHNVEPGLVVYVAAEAGKGFAKRKVAYSLHHGLQPDATLPFYLCTKRPDFFTSDIDVDALIAEIIAVARTYSLPLIMIVLDTLSALAPGMNENASQDVSRVRARLVRLQDQFSAAIILIHHKPKGGSTPRGHGSLTADFETTIEFESLPNRKRAIVRKQREGKSGIAWEFTLPIVRVGQNKWGNDETSCVVMPFTGEGGPKGGGFHASPNEMLFMHALFEALIDHGQPPPLKLPGEITKAVDIRHVRAAMKVRMISGEEDSTKADNRFRAAFKRAGDTLRRGGVIGFQNPLTWYTGKPVNGLSIDPGVTL
jgi:hypothetical protein